MCFGAWSLGEHTRMLKVNGRNRGTADFGIVVCAAVCEVLLDSVEE